MLRHTMPEIEEDTRDRLTRIDIDELDVNVRIHTNLSFPKIPTHEFSFNVYKMLSICPSKGREEDSQ